MQYTSETCTNITGFDFSEGSAFWREGEGNISKNNNTKVYVGDTRKTLLHYALAHTCIGS